MYLLEVLSNSLYTLKHKVLNYWSRDKEIINKDLPLSLSVDDAKCLDYDMDNTSLASYSSNYKKPVAKKEELKEVNDTVYIV